MACGLQLRQPFVRDRSRRHTARVELLGPVELELRTVSARVGGDTDQVERADERAVMVAADLRDDVRRVPGADLYAADVHVAAIRTEPSVTKRIAAHFCTVMSQ